MRHWNTIAGTLHKGEVYVPLLLKDENGVAHGNDWAHGFMRGMHMRQAGQNLSTTKNMAGASSPSWCSTTRMTKTRRCGPIRSARRSARTSSFTWRLVWWERIGISESIE
jgi:hypothetical protein